MFKIVDNVLMVSILNSLVLIFNTIQRNTIFCVIAKK